MSFPSWLKVAALALLPVAAIAQQSKQAGPTDANAPVPAPGYVSVFDNYRPAAEDQVSPVEVWRAANEEVARSDPHAGHGSPVAALRADTDAAMPKAAPSKSDHHASHGGQHQMQGK